MDAAAIARNGVTAIVEYDYTAKEPDELDLVKGAIIHSIKQMPGGWWEGTLKANGKTGMFPDNFVRVIDTTTTTAIDESNVTLRDKSTTKNRRCKVIYSYTQVNDDELSLAVGDVIEFLGEVEEGWWRGRLKTKIGVFPSNFVVEIEPSPVLASKRPITSTATAATALTKPAAVTSSSSSASAITNSNTSATTASALANAALAAVTTKKSNRLSFHNSREDLLNSSGTNNSSTASSSTTAAPPPAYDDVVTAAPVLPPKPQREYCRVEFPYAPQNDDELELKVGDVITIISMELPDKGWWKGELRGKVGVFPDNFVKLLAPPDVIPSANDSQQQQPPLHQTHSQKTAKTFGIAGMSSSLSTTTNSTNANVANASNSISSTTTTTTTQSHSSTATAAAAAASSSKVFIKKSGSTSSTQSSNRKDSFGSYDSLNDILSETGLQTGNVAAQRKSLENKNFDLSNAPDAGIRMGLKKQQQQESTISKTTITSSSNNNSNSSSSSSNSSAGASTLSTTTGELRKSLENMDEKTSKTTPPPVLTKKPNVPSKASTSVTKVAANLFTSLKTKVKNVENTLTTSASQDAADGVGSSKLSPLNASGLPDAAPSGNVVMRRAATIAVEDTEFDRVERASILPDMRAGRVKAPKRRPPSQAINAIGESNNNSIYLNGSSEMQNNAADSFDDGGGAKPHSSDENSTSEEQQLAKPKPREWEKKKAPWMEELKASQVKKKTSPNVEPRTAELKAAATTNAAATAAIATTKVQSSTITSTQQHATSIVESSSSSTHHQTTHLKKEHDEHSSSGGSTMSTTTTSSSAISSNNIDVMSKSLSGRLVDSTNPNVLDDVRAARPNSLSIRNRNVSSSSSSSAQSQSAGVNSTSSDAPLRSALKSSTTSATSASPGDGLSNKTAISSIATTTTTAHSMHSSSAAAKKLTNQHVNNHHPHAHPQPHSASHLHHNAAAAAAMAATNTTTATTATTSHSNHSGDGDGNGRIVDLECRIEKLETIVQRQQRTIDELVRTLREETDRVKVLRGELDKYAQCVTQV